MRTEKNSISNMKAQTWFMDFVVAMIIFTFILIAYYNYTTNISKQDSSAMDNLISDSKTIVSSLTTSGYPDNWNSNNVVRVGFTDNYNRLDNRRFVEFNEINYNTSKKLLGTTYDYLLFFVNETGDVQNVEGFCGTGLSEVEIAYEISAAYYYKSPTNEDAYLFEFMRDELNADIYTEGGGEEGVVGNYEALGDNLNNYGFVVLEAPEWNGGQYNEVYEEYNNWVKGGGLLMVSGELVSGNKKPMVGADFEKISGLSKPDEPATVVKEDEYFNWEIGDSLKFNQAFHAVFPSATDSLGSNFKNISNFNCTGPGSCDIEFADILAGNPVAISRWEYDDGKVFFFSDFNAQYFQGNFLNVLEATTSRWIGARCLPINITGIERSNLVKTERIVIHNSDLLKMVLYLWE